MERTVLEESWRRNRPVGSSLEVDDDDDDKITFTFVLVTTGTLGERGV
jgi:hypothetical protein